MAKYNGSVELISGLKQANGQDFPLVDASAVQVDESGTRLDKALEEKVSRTEIENISSSSVSVSKTEPTNESAEVWINPDLEENFSVPEIKDDTVNATDTWSSKKIDSELSSLKSNIDSNTESIKNNKILVDSTLENSGQAADAKITGDAITSLNEDLVDLKNASIFAYKMLNENIYKSGIAEVSVASTASAITDGIIVPVLKNDVANADISENFRYSVPMKIASDVFPKNKAVNSDLPVNLGYRVEFYFSGKTFEVMLFGYGYLTVCIDDNCVMEHSIRMPMDGNLYYQKITFTSEIEHKHISIYIDGIFRGIKTNGVIEKYNSDRLKIIADGDSITESTSIIGGGEAVINSWISKLSKVFDYDLLNVALGGTGYINNGTNRINMVDRFEDNVAKYDPDILISMGGLNDSYSDLSALETAINEYWNKVSKLGCRAICVTPFNPQSTMMQISDAFLPILQKTCAKYGVPLIDTARGITYDSTGSIITDNTNGYIKGIINSDNHDAFIGSDSTHLTLKGHEYFAKRMESELYKLTRLDKYFN